MDIALGLGAVLFLILINAFFVGVEFALVAVDRNTIEALAEEGDRRAKATLGALRALSFELSGAQLGITISSIVLGYIAEPTLARLIDPALEAFGLPEGTALGLSLMLALAIATSVQMVLGELVPKNIAIARPVPTALRLGGPGALANRIMKPLIVVFNGAANWTVRRLGVEPKDELTVVRSLEEIEQLIHSSAEGGFLRQEEFSLLSRSISFAGKTASDALVPRTSVVGVPADATLVELARISLEHGHSRFPVHGENLDDVKGIVLVKDVFAVPYSERASTPVAKIMQDAPIVPESRDLESLLLELRASRKQMAVVVDEYGGTAGIITVEDIIEEIVGDIEDEYDVGEAARFTQPAIAGVNVVSGMLHPDEVFEQTGFEMPPGDYETLAGFLLSVCGHIPQQGEHISYEDWEFKIIEMDRNRIDRVLIVAPGGSVEEPEEGSR
jgi:CBS domain containing-hemolysin-like protein